jgi:hypothetical protein
MKRLIKKLLYAVAPQWMSGLMSARARAHSHRLVKGWGCEALNQKLLGKFGNVVQEGPFAGLILSPMSHSEHLGPYLLGVYESELDPAWDIVLRETYSQIVDVGAKFGYYAIGLAKRYPNATVAAFDTDWWARRAIREMANANGVDNVIINNFCSSEWLSRNLCENAFIISDCEGYEATLFGKDMPTRLRTATLLIETHDCLMPGVTGRLRDAFGETHTVRVLGDGSIRRARIWGMQFLSAHDQSFANQEVRGSQLWLFCLPKVENRAGLQSGAIVAVSIT